MCGLVGLAGDLTAYRKEVIGPLLIVDSLRGDHSTGIAGVKRYVKAVILAKEPGAPSNLFKTPAFKDVMATPVKVIIGHNRYATIGAHTVENAHPFDFENVVGAHNGTLHKTDRAKLADWDKFGTDSEALFNTINLLGIEATIGLITDRYSAYALTWYDKLTNTINFLRNDERPLIYAYSEDRATLIWASEEDFLRVAAARCKIKLQDDKVFDVTSNTHYSWEVPEKVVEKFDLPMQTELKQVIVKTKNYFAGYGRHSGPSYWMDGDWFEGERSDHEKNYGNKTGTKYNNVFIFGDHKRRKDTKKWRPPYKDSRGFVLSKSMFENTVDQGCVCCGDANSVWGDFIQPFKSGGTKEYDYICESCYNDDETYEMMKQLI